MRTRRLAKSSVRSALWCLRPYYISAPESWSFRLRYLDSKVAINHEHKFVYVRIPKAANTTVALTLYQMIHGRAPDNGAQAKQSFQSPRQLTFMQARTAKADYFKFIVVRDPFARVLSAYLDKIVYEGRPPIFRQLVRRCLDIGEDIEISFGVFCQYLKHGGLHDDPHWIPQENFVRLIGVDNLDFIGKVENLEQDLEHASSIIFPGRRYEFQQEKRQHKSNAREKILKFYTEECEDIIRHLYRHDFTIFNYDNQLKRY